MHPPRHRLANIRTPAWVARVAVAFVLLALAMALLLAFPTIWLRPIARHFVREHAGRQIDFDALQFGLNASLQPVVRLRHLQIENAAWAAPQPLIRAAEFDVTVAWESLRGHGTIVPLLVIVDGDIDLEQQADGLRNWRLSNPQDRGPGRVRIQSLQASQSRMRVRIAGQDLEMALATTPLAAPRTLASRPELPLTQTLHVSGRRGNDRFNGNADTSQVLTLRDTGRPFALSGQVQSGPSHMEFEGIARDLLQFAGVDAAVHLTSTDLHALGAMFKAGALPSISAVGSARVRKDGPHWTVSDAQAHAGRSDLSGTLDLDRPPGEASRPILKATLASERLNWGDLHAPATHSHTASTPAANPRQLDGLDGAIDLTVASVEGLPLGRIGLLGRLHAHLDLRAGQVKLAPLSFAVAGGRAEGSLTVATAPGSPPAASFDMRLDGLRVDALTAAPSASDRPDGSLNLRVALQSRGDSLAALRDGAVGHVNASLLHATLPAAMEAKLALDGGQWLRAMMQPGKRVDVTCAVADMDIEAGRGRSRRLALETENVVLSGRAAVDLKHESFDLVLTPHRKQASLLALDKSLRLSGAIKQPRVGMVAGDESPAVGGCS